MMIHKIFTVNYYVIPGGGGVLNIITLYLLNCKISKIIIFVLGGTTVVYTIGKHLKYPQFCFFGNEETDVRGVGRILWGGEICRAPGGVHTALHRSDMILYCCKFVATCIAGGMPFRSIMCLPMLRLIWFFIYNYKKKKNNAWWISVKYTFCRMRWTTFMSLLHSGWSQ